MAVATVPFSWIACHNNQVRVRAEVVQRIRKMGGRVIDTSGTPLTVDLDSRQIEDKDLAVLAELPVEYLYLANTRITDAGLAQLARLSQLELLDLRDTRITDAGVRHLKGLAALRALRLEGTKATGEAEQELLQANPAVQVSGDFK
jgi:hypothetical protein